MARAVILALMFGVACQALAQAIAPAPHARDFARWTATLEGKSTNDLIGQKAWVRTIEHSVPSRFRENFEDALGGPPDMVKVADSRYVVLAACEAQDCGHHALFWYDAKLDLGIGAENTSEGLAVYSLGAKATALPKKFHEAFLAWVQKNELGCKAWTLFYGVGAKSRNLTELQWDTDWGCRPDYLSDDPRPVVQQPIVDKATADLKQDPHDIDALEKRAGAYFDLQRFDLAAADYGRASDLHNGDRFDRNQQAASLRYAGKLDEARAKYREEMAAQPDDWEPYDSLGDMAFEAGDYAEALRLYLITQQMDNINVQNHWESVGKAEYKLGRFRDALHAFVEARHDNTYDPLLHYYLGLAERAVGDKTAGRRDLAAAVKQQPKVLKWSRLGH